MKKSYLISLGFASLSLSSMASAATTWAEDSSFTAGDQTYSIVITNGTATGTLTATTTAAQGFTEAMIGFSSVYGSPRLFANNSVRSNLSEADSGVTTWSYSGAAISSPISLGIFSYSSDGGSGVLTTSGAATVTQVIGGSFSKTAGGNLIAVGDDINGLTLTDANNNSHILLETDSLPTSLSYTAGTTPSVGTWGYNISFDIVPEPSSTMLVGLGGIALLARRKR